MRRYRVRWTAYPVEGGYTSKTKEFGSLRAAAEHVCDLPSNCEFQEIRALELEQLTNQEKAVFSRLTDGKIVLS